MNIIFVCTGNTCRSPMAEGYLKSKNLPDLYIISRGFSGGETANEKSVAVMDEVSVDIKSHISKPITEDDISNADLIICMTESHRQALISVGADRNKTIVLANGVPDPYGCDISVYRKCRDTILDGIDRLINDGIFDGIKISSANQSYIGDIAYIEKECFSDPWSERSIEESMHAGTKFYIAEYGGKTVGYMGISEIAGEGYVTNVAVLKQYRNRGIGSKLLQYVVKQAKDNSCEFVSLEVRESNSAAISLYEKTGFVREGLRKNFYDNPKENAIIMTKRFNL